MHGGAAKSGWQRRTSAKEQHGLASGVRTGAVFSLYTHNHLHKYDQSLPPSSPSVCVLGGVGLYPLKEKHSQSKFCPPLTRFQQTAGFQSGATQKPAQPLSCIAGTLSQPPSFPFQPAVSNGGESRDPRVTSAPLIYPGYFFWQNGGVCI